MRTIYFILQKEFLQVFRNRQMLPIIFALPIIQLLILVNAATFEISTIKLFVSDQDNTPASRLLREHFTASGYFTLADVAVSAQQGQEAILNGKANAVLVIPPGFARDIGSATPTDVQMLINAVDGFAAGIIQSYAAEVLARFQPGRAIPAAITSGKPPGFIDIQYTYRYNTRLRYEIYMAPGILVLLITMIGLFLTGMNIVKEREMGTIEQLNVTPIRKYHFIIGKLLPFWILALAELAFGLAVAKIVFSVPIAGSLPLVFAMAAIYLLTVLGIGLLVSTVADTQQQSMFISWFIMVVFILMSGLFTPIESMPEWAQALTWLNPVRYFIEIMRLVLLKGSSFNDILLQFGILSAYGTIIIGTAVARYRKHSA